MISAYATAMLCLARPSRSLLSGAVLGALLVGCSYIPREIAGLPEEQPWVALPLRTWLAEDRGEPEAMAICAAPECGSGLVASVVRLAGKDAAAAQALLARPEPLAQALDRPRADGKARTRASVRRLRIGGSRGFLLALERADGTRPATYGAALGKSEGQTLRVLLVIGGNEAAVEATLRRVAVDHLGS